MPPSATQTRPSALTALQPYTGIILLEEQASSFDEILMSLHHGTPTFQYLLPPAGADSLEVMYSVVEQNRRRDRERIETLEQEVAELREAVGLDRPMPRKISGQQAKKEIVTYFSKNRSGSFDPDEIAQALNLDLSQTVKLCRELASEGEIVEAS